MKPEDHNPPCVMEVDDAIPAPIRCGSLNLTWGERTYIMGILNVTPDSFSDGGRFFSYDNALAQAKEMIAAGADIIDIGGESTRPGSEPVTVEEEKRRVLPVIEALVEETRVPVSLDTTKYEVAKAGLDLGVAMINDVSALRFDQRMGALVAEYDIPVVLMHMLGTPKTMQVEPRYECVIGDILHFLRVRVKAAMQAGIEEEMIIVDPGIGFGKTLAHNLEILRRLAEFKSLGRPVLVGPSRKRFIGYILDTPVDHRVEGTIASIVAAVATGVDMVRVHDIAQVAPAVKVADAIFRPVGLEKFSHNR